ncbi:oleate hydratase [Singulisphaera rosea]
MNKSTESHVWIIGGGVAGMAAAAFAIRDGRVPGSHIHILEQLRIEGGSLDGAPAPNQAHAWVTRGGRMLEDEAYLCTWDLFESIPSLKDPRRSVRQEIIDFNERVRTDAKARLIGDDHEILEASHYGLDTADRLEMIHLMGLPELRLGARRIEDVFAEHFFETHFWQMWRTMFAFQKWHSAAEMRRYMIRFVQEFDRIHTLSGVRRTVYNQYDSMIVPLQRWMDAQGVDVRFGVEVVDADFEGARSGTPGPRRVRRLHLITPNGPEVIELGEHDHALFTLGSITADTTYGGNDDIPELIRDRRDGSWRLWETLAEKAEDFGRPTAFCNIDEHKWESFTLTMRSPALLDRIVAYTGNEPGTGGLMTWIHSGWHLSIVVPFQPHFPDLPPGTTTLWGYGFEIDRVGDFVKKKMSEATGREILTELVYQLGFEDILEEIQATTDVTTVMMPYASSVFACRSPGDRPKVIPAGAGNFAFLGQFAEMPEDVVFTVEYSVHGAMLAVYQLLGIDREIPPIYQGLLDPSVAIAAIRASFQ